MRSKEKSAVAEEKGVQISTPRLRFPGFKKSWLTVPLGQLAFRSTVKNSDEHEKRVLTNSAEHGVVDQRDYFDKDIADQGNLQGYYVVQEGDYVYNPRISNAAPVGPISRNEVGTGVMSPLYTVFRFLSPHNEFFSHFFKSSRWHPYVRINSSTGARHDRMSIGIETFMRMPVPDIDFAEQLRITDCLSSLDTYILAEARKLDALKAHRLGLMQQMLPAKGECMPRVRFARFDGKWKARKLDEVIVTVTPPKKLQTSQYMQQGTYPIIDQSPQPIAGWTDDLSGLIAGPFPLIVFGDHTCVLKLVDKPFVQGADGIKILTAQKDVSTAFLFQCLKANPVDMLDYRRHFSQLKEIMVIFPEDPEEQSLIADMLANLDALIRAQVEMIVALANHKKGLLQGLFPVEVHA